jgi:transposase-like protein
MDALSQKVREGVRIINVAVLIAVGAAPTTCATS